MEILQKNNDIYSRGLIIYDIYRPLPDKTSDYTPCDNCSGSIHIFNYIIPGCYIPAGFQRKPENYGREFQFYKPSDYIGDEQ